MLRIRNNSLEVTDGKLFLNGTFFSGISFQHTREGCVGTIIKDGVKLEPYISKFFGDYPVSKFIDASTLDTEDLNDIVTIHGEKFTGIALEYSDDFCVGEIKFRNGRIASEVSWYKSGQIESLNLIESDLSQECEWFENGQLELAEITIDKQESATFRHSENSKLESLSISRDFFKQVGTIKKPLYCKIPYTVSELSGFSSSECLYLSGEGINDEVVTNLIRGNLLDNVRKIILFNVSLSGDLLLVLGNDSNIDKILLQGESDFMKVAQTIKHNRPRCYVEYNNQEIVI